MSLEGRRIAVAGAGGLLGPHVVRALAEQGAVVLAGDVREEALDAVRDVAAEAHVMDLSSEEGAQAWAQACGEVHGLLHLVGGWRGGTPLHETSAEDLAWLEAALFRTVVHATRAFAPALRAAGPRGRGGGVDADLRRRAEGDRRHRQRRRRAGAHRRSRARELHARR